MRSRIGILVTLALALSLASAVGADTRRVRSRGSDLLPLETFNVSGEFSGRLGGEVLLNGVRYQLASNVQVYEMGVGVQPAGTEVFDRHVFMAGVRTIGSDMIFTVIVLPPTRPSLDQDDPSSYLSIGDRNGDE